MPPGLFERRRHQRGDGTQPQISDSAAAVGRRAWLRDGNVGDDRDRQGSSFAGVVSLISCGRGAQETKDLTIIAHKHTADSSALLAVQKDHLSNVWTMAADGEAKSADQITSGKYNGWSGLSWTPDGRVVYTSNASGNPDIWIMNADGSGQKQLTANASANYYPSVSADGRYVLFVSDAQALRPFGG